MRHPMLQILRDHLHNAQTAPFDTDWDALLTLSKKHELAPIVYTQCKDFLPQPYLGEFRHANSAALFYSTNREELMSRIEAALADIRHFTIKGASVAAYYPVPELRTMGDTDIVLHTEDRDEADKRLRALGLERDTALSDREWQYYRNNMEFELHDRLVYADTVNVDVQERYFNDFWKYVKGNELDWNFHFLFLILHLRKHFMDRGVGFRQFADIAVLSFRGPKLDWAWIRGELEKLGLWAFAERVFALNEVWLDVPSPLAVSAPSEAFLSSATELIVKNGLFGLDNIDNRANRAVNATRGEGHSRASMLKRAWKGLFPSYQKMITFSLYAYMKGRPWLLPLAWLHRAVHAIKERRAWRKMRSVAKNSFADRETIERREALYEQWGL